MYATKAERGGGAAQLQSVSRWPISRRGQFGLFASLLASNWLILLCSNSGIQSQEGGVITPPEWFCLLI
jgi:hypothetical protein